MRVILGIILLLPALLSCDREESPETPYVGVGRINDPVVPPIITARGELARAGDVKENAFDGDTSTKWRDLSTTSWIQYEFGGGVSKVVSGYTITSSGGNYKRDPKDWEFLASNDGANWVTLDSRQEVIFPGRTASKEFLFVNESAYKIYRFEFTANNGNPRMIQLAEIEFKVGPDGPGDGEAVSFLAFGDAGTGESQQRKVANSMKRVCAKEKCSFAIMMGDNIYNSGVNNVNDRQFRSKFEIPYGPLKLPFYVSLGNHDARGNTQAQVDYTKKSRWWKMLDHYYEKDIGDIKLIAIDSNDFNNSQKNFVRAALRDSSAGINIVFGHHPIYSYGSHGDTRTLVRGLLPILCDFPNVVYVAGHDHDMQVLKSGCGVPLFISGAAAKLRSTRSGPRSIWAKSTYGYTIFSYVKGKLDVKFYSQNDSILFRKSYPLEKN